MNRVSTWSVGLFRPLVAGLVLTALAACGENTGVNLPSDAPRVNDASVLHDGGPIFRSLAVELDRPGGVLVDYWAEDTPRLRIREDALRARHELFLPRLRADHTYRFEVRTVHASGVIGTTRTFGRFVTGPLPPGLREIEISTVGVPTFPLVMMEAVDPVRPFYPFVVDEEGHVVWYRTAERGSTGFARLDGGAFAFNTAGGVWVVNLRNEVLSRLNKFEVAVETGVDPFTIHHDIIRTPQNTLLMLVQDTTLVNDTIWTGEAIWEWDPASDRLDKRWASKDFFDPRTDRGSLSVPGDWLHANSLSLGPRGNVVVSLFWLHEVFSIAPDFQSLEWRLGGPASTFDVEDDAMEAGQHTAAEVAPDRVLMFDNGRERTAGLYSRALEMEIDRDAGTARVAWQFRPNPDVYAPIISSAVRLDNGNTVVGFGMSEGSLLGASGPISVFEVTANDRVLWRLDVVRGLRFVYRATPLSSLGGETVLSMPPRAPARDRIR